MDLLEPQGLEPSPSKGTLNLLNAMKGSKLPIRPLQGIKAEVERICGGRPQRPTHGDRPVAIVKWVDGTVLDSVWRVI